MTTIYKLLAPAREAAIRLCWAVVPLVAMLWSVSAIAATPAETNWERSWWLDKAARLLRAGEGLGPSDPIDQLTTMAPEKAIRKLMDDPRFGNAMLDFNLYFIGFKLDRLMEDGVYADEVFDFSNAISSAQEMMRGGDYLKLFDLESSFYPAPLRSDALDEPMSAEDAGLTPKELRRRAMREVRNEFGNILKSFGAGGTAKPEAVCVAVGNLVSRDSQIFDQFYRAFSDAEIFGFVRARLIAGPLEAIAGIADEECSRDSRPPDVDRIRTAVERAVAQFDKAFAELERFEPDVYQPHSLLEIKPFDPSALPYLRHWIAFGYQQATALVNSSTNFNRKRAAYILNRYLCDDLNPVGFDTPIGHIEGMHGSDTSCYACHYKLDPMAGFFRNYGALFSDSTRLSDIVFDDLSSLDRREYTEAWLAKPETGRKWEVGYIRSPRWPATNDYGESIADLSRIIRNAPEAKRCVVKRFFEYAVGENQTVDRGYLDTLTERFVKRAATNSSEAMKDLIVDVLTSRTFRTRDPDPRQCYDTLVTGTGKSSPPCRVSFILDSNCSKCHDNVWSGEGNLDLTGWTGLYGQAETFPHLDSNMEQIPIKKTLTMMLQRLTTTDPKKRMPKNKVMSTQDRQELYLWVRDELNARSKAQRP